MRKLCGVGGLGVIKREGSDGGGELKRTTFGPTCGGGLTM